MRAAKAHGDIINIVATQKYELPDDFLEAADALGHSQTNGRAYSAMGRAVLMYPQRCYNDSRLTSDEPQGQSLDAAAASSQRYGRFSAKPEGIEPVYRAA